MFNTLEETLNALLEAFQHHIEETHPDPDMRECGIEEDTVQALKSLILSEAQRIGFEVIGTPLTYAHMDLDQIEGSYDTAFEQGSEKTVELQRRRLLELTGGKK